MKCSRGMNGSPVQGALGLSFFLLAVLLPASSGAALWPGDTAASGAHTGREVVEGICVRCHGTGDKGAPRIGDSLAWSRRSAQGLTSLTEHALTGIRRMPAHGGSPGLTDLEISRAITYMVNQSGGHWVEPVAEAARERSGEEVVKGQCVKCHQAGVNGAPRIGDSAAWTPRMRHGIEYLVRSAVHGHGGMPPRGGKADLTDGEVRAAILYMFDPKFTPGAAGAAPVPSTDAHANHAIAGNLEVFLGIVPAESLRTFPQGSTERTMHGGVPDGADQYHLNVSLVEKAGQAPVGDAQVRVRCEPVGSVGNDRQVKDLEPIPVGPGSYGHYVQFQKGRTYTIVVEIRRPGAAAPVEARFEQSFF